MILILGAGIAGLSCSYHIGHEKCQVLERENKGFGHIGSLNADGFVWDQGPHVSFTKNQYVQNKFAEAVSESFLEFEVCVSNFYKGHWIGHPAQTSLYQVPEPLRSECIDSLLKARRSDELNPESPLDYAAWLRVSLGPKFAEEFSAVYTKKYWTVNPEDLTIDWVGHRILRPAVEDVIAGGQRPLGRAMHYIQKVRYPTLGGYEGFGIGLEKDSKTRLGAKVVSIDLKERHVILENGEKVSYESLINTIPLPNFIAACINVPNEVRNAALELSCTELLLVNVGVPHSTQRPEHWVYVYDQNKITSRISITEKFSPNNAPPGWSGIQAEVYYSKHKPLSKGVKEISEQVYAELCEMGFVKPIEFKNDCLPVIRTQQIPWANVIFHKRTSPALNTIWSWLEQYGLKRESDDLHPLTDWENRRNVGMVFDGQSLFMAGRFGQWKYFWSDDCVLRGREIAERVHG